MHILFLTDNFYPETNAPAIRTFEHAKIWVKKGHKVTIITSNPNFPEGVIHQGYKNKLISYEVIDGIRIIRVWTFMTENKGFFLRVLDQFSFAVSSFFAGIFLRKVGLIIGTSPQFFTIFATYLLSRVKKKKWIFEVRDLWPESLIAVGALKDGIIYNLLHWFEKFFYNRAAHIIVVTKSFKSQISKYGIEDGKISVIRNGIDTDIFHPHIKPFQREEFGLSRENFVVGYVGTIGMAHNVETLIAAAKICQDRNLYDIKFLIIGNGAQKKNIEQLRDQLNLKNTMILGKVNRDSIPSILRGMDASIILLKNDPVFKKVIPSKIFESIAVSLPIILGVEGETKELIENGGYGTCFEPENPDDLVQQILKMRNNKNDYLQIVRNQAEDYTKYSRKYLALDMLKIIKTIYEKK